jgi:hypothetical protein
MEREMFLKCCCGVWRAGTSSRYRVPWNTFMKRIWDSSKQGICCYESLSLCGWVRSVLCESALFVQPQYWIP